MKNPTISAPEVGTPEFARFVDADPEAERILAFQEALGRCASKQVIGQNYIDFELLTPVKHAVGLFKTYEYNGLSGFYVESPHSELLGAEDVSFGPRNARGGRNSAHGVFFGDIIFGDNKRLPVAVKPHQLGGANESVLTEHYNTRAVRGLGLYSLEPVAVLLGYDNSESAYMITKLEETLTTLDTIDWSDFYPKIDSHPGMTQIWSQIARQVAFLHSSGSNMHGDLAGRNIAITADDYAFLIDWERSHISKIKPRDAEIRYAFSHPDLSMLVETFVLSPNDRFKAGLGIFYGKQGNWWQGFRDIFLNEYIDTRLQFAETNNDQQDVKEEIEVLLASLQNDMEAAWQYSQG